MPTVPRYGQPRVSEAPLPGVRVSPAAPVSAFVGPGAPDLSGLTGAIAQMAADEKRKADQLVELDTDNQLRTLQNDLTKRGLSRLGKDAMGATEEATGEWEKRVGEIEQGLKNDTQRATFRAHVQQRYDSMFSRLESHAFTEQRKYDEQETQTAVANRQADAVENYGDPAKVSQALAETRAILADYATRNGLGPEARKAATEEAVSKVHMGVLNQMLADGKDLAAKSYLADHRTELNGDDLTRVDAAMREGSVRGESQRQADAIMGRGLSRTDALTEARKIEDPDTRDMTVQRINRRYDENDRAQRDAEEQALTDAGNILDRTGGNIDAIPPSKWQSFTPGQKSGLRSYARQLARGEPVETDWQTYYDLMNLAASDNPALRRSFAEANLPMLRSKLSDSDFRALHNLQLKLRAGDTAGTKVELQNFQTEKQVVDGKLLTMGLDPTPKPSREPDSDAVRVTRIRQLVGVQKERFLRANGREPTETELGDLVDGVLVDVVTKEPHHFLGMSFGGDERPLFEVAPSDSIFVTFDQIPAMDRALISAELDAQHLPVTNDRVVRIYQEQLRRLANSGKPIER